MDVTLGRIAVTVHAVVS